LQREAAYAIIKVNKKAKKISPDFFGYKQTETPDRLTLTYSYYK